MKYFKIILLQLILLWPAMVYSGWFISSNLWECILDEMPGVKNDFAATEIIRKCRKEYPNSTYVEKKSNLFGTKTAGECVINYSKDVSSRRGAKHIRAACYKLYPRD